MATDTGTTRLAPRLGEAGPWTKRLAISSFALAGVYLINASIQGFPVVIASFGRSGWLFGLLLVSAVLFASRIAFPAWAIGVIAVVLAAIWGLVVDGQPESDFLNFYEQASTFAGSPSFEVLQRTKSPTTVLIYGSWMKLAGVSVTSARLVGAMAHGLVSATIMVMAGYLRFPQRVGRAAALLFALSPGVLTYTSVLSSESVLLATVVPGMALFVRELGRDRPRPPWLAAAGFLLGMSYLAVPVGGFFAMGAAAFLTFVVIDSRKRQHLKALAVLVIAMAIAPAFQVGLNVGFEGYWSPVTSDNSAMGFFSGSSIECNGRWCLEELEAVGFIGEDVDFEAASERALATALGRWGSDPWGMIRFTVTTKVREMWRHESSHMLAWALRQSPRLADWESETIPFLRRSVDAYHLGVLTLLPLAVVVTWWKRRLPLVTSAIALGMVGTGALHMLMVVQQRYHLVFLPFVFGLIAVAAFGARDHPPPMRWRLGKRAPRTSEVVETATHSDDGRAADPSFSQTETSSASRDSSVTP